MKKYIICFLLCAVVFSGAYWTTYMIFSDDKEETRDLTMEEDYGNVQVISNDDIIKQNTQLIIENYNLKTEESEKEVLTMPALYLGLTRNGILEKLDEYMNNLSVKDLEDGLVSYDLLYFSTDHVMLRKTYNPSEDFNKYYIKLSRGQVTVYYSDHKTVYEYTDIDINSLPTDIKISIINGMDIKDDKELYDFLENYTT